VVPLSQARRLVGRAGTVTTVTSYLLRQDGADPSATHGVQLTLAQAKNGCVDLMSMRTDERAALPGMVPGRADVLGAGALVVALVLTGCAPSSGDQSGLQVSGLSSSATSAGPTGTAGTASSSGTSSSSGTGSRSGAAATTLTAPSTTAAASRVAIPPVVPGYSYLAPPATATAAFSKLAGAYPGVFGVAVVRTVKQQNNSVGTVGFLPLTAASTGAGAEDGVVRGLVQGMSGKGYTITTSLVGSHKLVLAASKQGTIVAWYRDGVVAVVTSTNPPPRPVAFATAALA
jgi:hypothetical protein